MSRRVLSYLELAAETAVSKTDDRRSFFHGAIGIRSDGAIVRSLNSSTEVPNRLTHAEAKLAAKLDRKAEVFVSRVRYDLTTGKQILAISRPCFSCLKILHSRGVDVVHYSIADGEYGSIDDLVEAMNAIKRISGCL